MCPVTVIIIRLCPSVDKIPEGKNPVFGQNKIRTGEIPVSRKAMESLLPVDSVEKMRFIKDMASISFPYQNM